MPAATVEKPNTEFNLSALDVFDARKKSLLMNGGKDNNKSNFDWRDKLQTVLDVVRLFSSNNKLHQAVLQTAKQKKVAVPTLYGWLRGFTKEEVQAMANYKNYPLSKDLFPASLGSDVNKIKVLPISKLVSEGEAPEPKRSYTRSNKKVMDSELKVSFCPCCGTDIEAVRIALTLAQ